jgi:hypothetical protein
MPPHSFVALNFRESFAGSSPFRVPVRVMARGVLLDDGVSLNKARALRACSFALASLNADPYASNIASETVSI